MGDSVLMPSNKRTFLSFKLKILIFAIKPHNMSIDLLKIEALKLSKLDRIDLLKVLADSLASEVDDTIDEELLAELERRAADSSPDIPSSDVKAKLKAKYGLRG